MKKLIILLFGFLLFGEAFAQNGIDPQSEKEKLLVKSRTKKTAGIIVLGLGAGGVSSTLFAYALESAFRLEGEPNPKINTVALLGSVILLFSCIHLFEMSAKNKTKANSIEITSQPVSILNQHGMSTISQPALSVKIAL